MKIKLTAFYSVALFVTVPFLVGILVPTVFAAADDYPSRPIRLIIPLPPGGSTDVVARLFATKLTERLGKQVVCENRSGAGILIGTEAAAKAEPDGYTLLCISASHLTEPAFYNKFPFDPIKAFTPIAKLGEGPNVVLVHPSVPANSVQEFIALAKQRPGQLIWASGGFGTLQHLAAELFKMMTGTDFKIVQFKGGDAAMIDQIGGHSHISCSAFVQSLPQINAGKLRALGTTGLKRSPFLPDLPSIAEAGLAGYEATGWWGIVAPARTPQTIVSRLNNEIKAIVAMSEVKSFFNELASQTDYLPPTEFGEFLSAGLAKWAAVVKAANLKKND